MNGLKCNKDSIMCYLEKICIGDGYFSITILSPRWCAHKLPCGRCVVEKLGYKPELSSFEKLGCKPELSSFDCDSCRFRFFCLTCDGGQWQWEMIISLYENSVKAEGIWTYIKKKN